MAEKRWLLINPPTGKYIRETRCQAPVKGIIATSLRPPLDLAYIAACVRKHSCECKIVDYPAEELGWDHFKREIHTFKPDFVVASTTTFTIREDTKTFKIIKEINPEIVTLAKGAVFYVKDQDILEKCTYLDIAVINDDEMGFSDIAAGYQLSQIPGIIYRDGGHIIKNKPRMPINLDDLPYPRRDLINNQLYVRPDNGELQTTILVGRGCNAHCIYCIAPLVGGSSVRYRSVDSVIDEVKFCINKYKIMNFYFLADNFTADRQWVFDFCKKILANDIAVNWTCNSRVDSLDDERLSWMKRAGCWGISMGIESGSQEILDKIGKGVKLIKIKNSVALCKKYGMVGLFHFMIGFPWDSKKTVNATIKFARSLKGGIIEFNIVTPFPGTKLQEIVQKMDLILPEKTLDKVDYSVPVIRTLWLSSEDLSKLRKKAFITLYCDPLFWINSLKLIKSAKQFWFCFKMFFKKLAWIVVPYFSSHKG